MHKTFDFKIRILMNLTDLIQGKFSGRNNSCSTFLLKKLCSKRISQGHLGACVKIHFREMLSDKGEDSDILDDYCIQSTRIQRCKIIVKIGLLRPASFFTLKNFLNITRQAAPLAMVALGATFVMTINEFDLSIGNIVSLGGVVAALLSIQGVPIPVCFLAAILAGLAVGCVNGVIVAQFGILSFITTLGMGTVLDGVIYGLTGGTTVFNGIPKAFTIPGILKIAGIPFITIVAAVFYIVFHMFMNHMSAGRKLYAIGGSREAAETAGIRIFRYRVLAFALGAAMAGLAGALVASRVGSANTTAGQGYFLQSYAAVFIGCTVSKSGVPCVAGTLVGTIILAVLANGLTILQMPSFMQNIITGGIIILAVVI